MKKVTMYTGNPCSYCSAAKALLKTKNVEIEEIDIWKDPANAKEMLRRTNGARTIPQILLAIIILVGMINYRKQTVMEN